MCNPMVTLGAQALSGGMATAAAYGQARSQRSGLRYEADMADLNAVTSERQAAAALERGQFQVNQVRRSAAQIKGTARQTYGRSNIEMNSGTPAEVLTGVDVMSEVDAQQAEINAIREAWGYRTQAENERSAARSGRATASAISPGMAAATTLLGSATSWAGSYAAFDKAGAFSKPSSPRPSSRGRQMAGGGVY